MIENEIKSFRLVIVRSLKSGLDSFSLNDLKNANGVSDRIADHAARDVFMSQCLRAAEDGIISEREERTITQLADSLQLSTSARVKCLKHAKEKVFENELKAALSDGSISTEEVAELQDLRKVLGLSEKAAEDFGPLAPTTDQSPSEISHTPKPSKRKKKRKRRSYYGSPSPVLGIPYIFLLGPIAFTLMVGLLLGIIGWWYSWFESASQFLSLFCLLVLLSVVFTPFFILYKYFYYRCNACGASWSVYLSNTERQSNWFSSGGKSEHEYTCVECGDRTYVTEYHNDND